jgi:hypothetical protein
MPDTELAVGESMTRTDGGLTIETTRTEEHLFVTTYRDPETGDVTLALQVDITTGATAIDPRHLDESFWRLVAEGEERPVSALQKTLAALPDPSIEVKPEDRAIHVYTEADR